jgi:hypothetical protein
LGAAKNFHTIMSYGCQDRTASAAIFSHSNPLVPVTRGGVSYPTGNSRANCVGGINKNAAQVAAYRSSKNPGGGDGGDSGTTTCISGGTCSSPNVCARFGTQDVCCNSNFPYWCGGSVCYSSKCTSGRRMSLSKSADQTPSQPTQQPQDTSSALATATQAVPTTTADAS